MTEEYMKSLVRFIVALIIANCDTVKERVEITTLVVKVVKTFTDDEEHRQREEWRL